MFGVGCDDLAMTAYSILNSLFQDVVFHIMPNFQPQLLLKYTIIMRQP